jgi:hypothetical protein
MNLFYKSKTSSVTVILTVYKRRNLDEQLNALLNQTKPPENIWILHYENFVSINKRSDKNTAIRYFDCDVNLKYFGRFSLAIHAPTTYAWVLDDDIIPSATWIETCIRTSEQHRAIVCSNGRIIPPRDYQPEKPKGKDYLEKYFIGDIRSAETPINSCAADTQVDFGCCSYFFKTEWIRHFWAIWPKTFATGEDMHLAATCKLLGNVNVVIPKQTSWENSGNIKPAYGVDEEASWKKKDFISSREEVLKFLINDKKWKPLHW